MIEIKDLRFRYQKNKDETIQGLNFKVEEGEIFGFLGPSGAGKSTTQKIITGILKDYKGSVKVKGKEIREVKADYYENIGISFEFPNLYGKLTGKENLDFFRGMYSVETETPLDLLKMVGLEDSANKRVSEYSKGMKMRLNFCRAFLNKPDLFFMDEPTSGQDPVNARNIKNIIRSLKSQGKTVFLTTHNMNDATELCDRVAFIVEGKISLIDSPRNLMVERTKKVVRVEYTENGSVIQKEFPLYGLGNNPDFIGTIRQHQPDTIHSVEATLEDIFVEVTGHELNPGGKI